MTRRGSIAYYLAAWICGCVFMGTAVWLRGAVGHDANLYLKGGAPGFFMFNFVALIFGAVPALIGGFLLRQIMELFGWQGSWQWMLAGGLLAAGVVSVLAFWQAFVPTESPPHDMSLSWLLSGPRVVLNAGWWLVIPAGAATAWVLQRIENAFASKNN